MDEHSSKATAVSDTAGTARLVDVQVLQILKQIGVDTTFINEGAEAIVTLNVAFTKGNYSDTTKAYTAGCPHCPQYIKEQLLQVAATVAAGKPLSDTDKQAVIISNLWSSHNLMGFRENLQIASQKAGSGVRDDLSSILAYKYGQ